MEKGAVDRTREQRCARAHQWGGKIPGKDSEKGAQQRAMLTNNIPDCIIRTNTKIMFRVGMIFSPFTQNEYPGCM